VYDVCATPVLGKPIQEFAFPYLYTMRSWIISLLILSQSAVFAQADSLGSLSGKINDANSGEPVIGAVIRIVPSNNGGVTDFYGIYSIEKIPSGTYVAIVTANDFFSDTINGIVIRPDSATVLNIRLKPNNSDTVYAGPYWEPRGYWEPIPPLVTKVKRKRLAIVGGTETVLAVGSLIALNEVWYKDYPRSSFHTFNDNGEWLGMDKVGHMQTAYTTGRISFNLLRWCNVPYKKSIWIGGLTGFVYQTAIEVLDGYSSEWGFSTGDILANATGSALFIGQDYLWNEQRIVPKFGFQRSGFAKYRPEILGSTYPEQLIKDYNGQTYWLSVNIASFMKEDTRVPKWLNLAFGYGATGMTGGHANPPMINAQGNAITFDRSRQYYLSFDIDVTRIKTKSRVLRLVFNTFGFIKIPAPGIEVSKTGVRPLLFAF
jgi:hypothetical protein